MSTQIACDLTVFSEDDRTRHDVVTTQWRSAIQGVEELADGYGFRFEAGEDILLTLAEFVARERLCCPFFRFEIVTEAGDGSVWLNLRGEEPVKAFLNGMIAALSTVPT